MKDFDKKFFIEDKASILAQNLIGIYQECEMKNKELIEKMHDDIMLVFKTIFTDGDEKKALAILDDT